jgi:hypothetical protein
MNKQITPESSFFLRANTLSVLSNIIPQIKDFPYGTIHHKGVLFTLKKRLAVRQLPTDFERI